MMAGLKTRQAGTLDTIAGNGEPGYSGDGGPAVAASLNEPKNLVIAVDGSVFIADSENHCIRRVDGASGIITTVAGCPPEAEKAEPSGRRTFFSPTEVEPDEGEDPLADPPPANRQPFRQQADLSGTVRFVTGAAQSGVRFGGDGGPATRASLNFPSAVAVDARSLYIADTMNHRIRRVDLRTGVIETLAGTGQHRHSGDDGPAAAAALNEPCALLLDGEGRLYVADQSNHRVRCIHLQSGVITTVAGTGAAGYTGDGVPAREAGLSGPSGLTWGPAGELYIADTFNGRIRSVDRETGVISTLIGDGSDYRYGGRPGEFSTSLSRPYGIALDRDGNVLITDSDSHLIRRWHRSRKIITVVAGNGAAQFTGDGLAAVESSLNYPFGVCVAQDGNVLIADTFNHRIRVLAA